MFTCIPFKSIFNVYRYEYTVRHATNPIQSSLGLKVVWSMKTKRINIIIWKKMMLQWLGVCRENNSTEEAHIFIGLEFHCLKPSTACGILCNTFEEYNVAMVFDLVK